MSKIGHYFTTKVYQAMLRKRGVRAFNEQLRGVIDVLAVDDVAGQTWSQKHGYPGYTSYASLDDLTWRMPEFASLAKQLDAHVQAFAGELDYELGEQRLKLDSLWVNVLEPGGFHGAHIHPHSVISGTYYVEVPADAAAIRFEDPRHAMMMASPMRSASARCDNKTFVTIEPKPGMVLLWESWLRHDVPLNQSDDIRISVSFNYGLAARDV